MSEVKEKSLTPVKNTGVIQNDADAAMRMFV